VVATVRFWKRASACPSRSKYSLSPAAHCQWLQCCGLEPALGTTAHCLFAETQLPNLAVNRTSNGGAQWLASQRPCRRWLPVTSTLGLSCAVKKHIVRNAMAHPAVVPEVACRVGALHVTLGPSALAVRPLAAGEPIAPHHAPSNRRRGLSVRRRPARHRLGSEEAVRLCAFMHRVFSEAQFKHNSQIAWVCSVMAHSFISLALRSTAAPGRWFGAGTGFARAGGVGAFGYQENTHAGLLRTVSAGAYALGRAHKFTSAGSEGALSTQRPNPSIEGTSTSKLRLLAAAPHVKR